MTQSEEQKNKGSTTKNQQTPENKRRQPYPKAGTQHKNQQHNQPKPHNPATHQRISVEGRSDSIRCWEGEEGRGETRQGRAQARDNKANQRSKRQTNKQAKKQTERSTRERNKRKRKHTTHKKATEAAGRGGTKGRVKACSEMLRSVSIHGHLACRGTSCAAEPHWGQADANKEWPLATRRLEDVLVRLNPDGARLTQ